MSGSSCISIDRRKRRRPNSWLVMSVYEGVGLRPNALVVKAFQRVRMAADCRERSNRSCCCGREGVWMWGGGNDCVLSVYIACWIFTYGTNLVIPKFFHVIKNLE